MCATTSQGIPTLPCAAAKIIDTMVPQHRRLLLFGPPGAGKSTLAEELGHEIVSRGYDCCCISADPGSPGFGVPGAITLAKWDHGWQVRQTAALCSLNAGRFRLPLVSAVRSLVNEAEPGVLVIDGPGVVRGPSGRELLQGLVSATEVDAVLLIVPDDSEPPLLDELRAIDCALFIVHGSAEARRPGQRARSRRRTEQWESYLAGAVTKSITVGDVNVIGTPPPLTEVSVWPGRQVALQLQGQTVAMGEVMRFDGEVLQLRLPSGTQACDTLLVRDAKRGADGLLETAPPFLAERIEYLPPADLVPSVEESGGQRIVANVGQIEAALLNGVFGDPLLHIRLRHQGRSLLFDLGAGARLPARLAHQVSDIFISHAHMDHLSGFQWFLRSRLNSLPPCRLYGPPGLAHHISSIINGFLWDRIGEKAPIFLVSELQGNQLQRFRIAVGGRCETLDTEFVNDGVILEEEAFCIRAVELDHLTPVLAFSLEERKAINVRKDRLKTQQPGPWLSMLKEAVLEGNEDVFISLPDGTAQRAGVLAEELLQITPGKKLVYATDLGDTPENRQRLIALAQHAHTLFCEAPFIVADAEKAARSGHLTTRACGEIANAAGVGRLVPFHFSRRYSDNPQQLYEEIDRFCGCLVRPG